MMTILLEEGGMKIDHESVEATLVAFERYLPLEECDCE